MSQDFARSGKNRVTAKTKFESGRVTAQTVTLLLPSLIDNIYFVICIGLIRRYLRLTFHSVTIDTFGGHLTLSAHRRTAGIFIMVCMYNTSYFSNYGTSCYSHFSRQRQPFLLDPTRGCLPLSQHRAEYSIHH